MKRSVIIRLAVALMFGVLSASALYAQSPSSAFWTEQPTDEIPPDSLAAWRRGGLEGYTDKQSVKQGELITFYVSVRNDLLPSNYTVQIYRVGANDQFMTTLGPFTGNFEPLHKADNAPIYPGLSPAEYMAQGLYPVEYRKGRNWPAAFSLTIPSNWTSGFYYAKLILSTNPSKVGAIPFVVKEDSPGSTSKMLAVIAWNTYAAYNYWGGGSLYWWTGIFDTSEKAYIDTVSFRRPFGYHKYDCCVQSDSLGQFNQRERSFVKWAESNGLTLEYCIDLDIEQDDPDAVPEPLPFLRKYKAVIFPGHSEYWSRKMRLNISDEPNNTQQTTFMKLGWNVAFFAANNCYWRVDYLPGFTRMYCGKFSLDALWRRQPEGPEAQFMAVQFHGTNYPGPNLPNIVRNQNHWIFQGTNLVNGQSFGLGNSNPYVPELAAGEIDQRVSLSPANTELLAKVFIRLLNNTDEPHYGEVDSLFSEMTYWEDTNTNARVFAAGGLEHSSALYGTDGNKLGIMTTNILDHFSFKKFRGNIYANILTWGDEQPLEASTILDGDTYILPQKTLSLVNGFTLTINPGVTLYVQGTLSLASNVTITGGGTVVIQGSGKILASNSAEATAFNNSRKIVRDASGNYHVVFETEGEICYEMLTSSTALSKFQRLSSGNGNNKYPSIAERSSTIFVTWQRQNGTTHDVYYRRYASSAWGSIQTLASNTGSNAPLPVIASPATNEVIVVYRTAGNLGWRRSTNNGSSWSTAATISGTALNSPSVAPGKTPWGAAAAILAYATNIIPNASNVLIHYYYNGWSSSYNLSSGLPGNLSQHANPSIAGSGDLTSSLPHTAWDAYDSQYSGRVILHKIGWGSSSYYEFHYQTEDRPSITGLAGTTAEMIFRRGSDYFFTGHYNGSSWNIPLSPQPGKYPSFSLGNTQAKYVITSGSASPYEVKLSSTTFSKAAFLAENTGSGNSYHRAVGLVNTTTGEWLNVRVENYLVKHTDGSFSVADFSAAPSDTAVLSSTTAWAALASAHFTLPADAESLTVVLSIAGDKVTSLANGQNPLSLQFKAQTAAGQSMIKNFPASTFVSNQPFNQPNLRISVNTTGFSSGALLSFNANLDNQKTGATLVASLGHIYEYVDNTNSAFLNRLANQAPSLPTDFVLEQNYPNPFRSEATSRFVADAAPRGAGKPETHIRYSVPKNTQVAIRIYNVYGQVVATLYDGEQAAGTHLVKWNGLNSQGQRVSSGIYFYKLETKDFVQVRKLVLAK